MPIASGGKNAHAKPKNDWRYCALMSRRINRHAISREASKSRHISGSRPDGRRSTPSDV